MEKTFSIVDITSNREMVVKEKPHTNLTKFYQFDKSVWAQEPAAGRVQGRSGALDRAGHDGIQLHSLCLRTDRDGEDLHHGGRGDEELGRHHLGQ